MLGRERDRIDKVWLVTDDAPIAPGLRAALAAAPAVQVLRVPRRALAAWLAPAAGESLESHLYVVDPMGHWMMRAPADADPSKLQARYRAAVARVGFLGPAGPLTAQARFARAPEGAQAAWERPGAGLRSTWC